MSVFLIKSILLSVNSKMNLATAKLLNTIKSHHHKKAAPFKDAAFKQSQIHLFYLLFLGIIFIHILTQEVFRHDASDMFQSQ